MIVGIVSDTHGVLPIKADCALAGCDHIIHAGDICDKNILKQLRIYAPVTAVLGNNDYPEFGPHVGRWAQVELDGVRFLVAHYPQDVMGDAALEAIGMSDAALETAESYKLPDVCIHGHTHIPRIVEGVGAKPAKLLICPGSCSRPRRGNPATIAKVDIENAQVESVRIECIDNSEAYLEWHV